MPITKLFRLAFLNICLSLLILFNIKVFAGPPFLTDDPVPVAYQNGEFYLFSFMDDSNLGNSIDGPAVELNYGLIPNLQLHTIISVTTIFPKQAGPNTAGLGDTEVGIKYRFIQETEYRPQVAIYPILELPTGDARRNLGNGRAWERFPIWLQKSWGSWTTYGGGGYAFNSATGMRNFPFAGWLLQRNLNPHLSLGAEAFYQGSTQLNQSSTTILDAGGIYNFTKNFGLLVTIGHSVQGQRNLVSYLGLYWNGRVVG